MSTTVEQPIWEKTPQEAAEEYGLDIETMRSRSLKAYLMHDERRTEAGFRALWSKWERGKANMPLCVQTALETGDAVDIVSEFLGR